MNGEFSEWITSGEDWLIARVLRYARERNYVKYTSTLEEAWRISIRGLSEALVSALGNSEAPPELGPDDDFQNDPIASFGIVEAELHRSRGVTLTMFLGLMKYYKQSYLDLLGETQFSLTETERLRLFVERFFDRVELGFCSEWKGKAESELLEELQDINRQMTNEKNKYLTIFESLTHPVILLDPECRIDNLNHAATEFLHDPESPGATYYQKGVDREVFTWFSEEIKLFLEWNEREKMFEKQVDTRKGSRYFEVRLKKMLDVSEKFRGITVILEDISERKFLEGQLAGEAREREKVIVDLKAAIADVQKLSGLLPICASCKKVRNDQGYWEQIEVYIRNHSEADFSHGICPECFARLYPEFSKTDRDERGEKT